MDEKRIQFNNALDAWNDGKSIKEIAEYLNISYYQCTSLIKLAKQSSYDLFIDADCMTETCITKINNNIGNMTNRFANKVYTFTGQKELATEYGKCISPKTFHSKVTVVPKNHADMQMCITVLELAYLKRLSNTIVICANDSDFLPLVETLIDQKYKVIIIHRPAITNKELVKYYRSLGVTIIKYGSVINSPRDYFISAVKNVNNALVNNSATAGTFSNCFIDNAGWDFNYWFNSREEFFEYFNQMTRFKEFNGFRIQLDEARLNDCCDYIIQDKRDKELSRTSEIDQYNNYIEYLIKRDTYKSTTPTIEMEVSDRGLSTNTENNLDCS